MIGAAQPVASALDGIGARHDRAWLNAELVNACAHGAAMSSYNCSQVHNAAMALTQQQRDQIVTYLLTLR
jgi:hypothetical protein